MTERKWTPGPWVADVSDPSDAIVWAGEGKFLGNVGSSRIQGVTVAFDVDAANAQLIAAAPDLYEALEICGNWIDDEAMEPDTRDFDSLMSVINAALAKARGETQ